MQEHPKLPTMWVSAAPFRYHVQRLMAETYVPWQVIAVVADLPLQQVRVLLFGRGGHRRPRLSPYAARRLLALDQAQLLRMQLCDLPVHHITESIQTLLAEGVSASEIADWLKLDLDSVRRLISGVGMCSQTVAVMLRILCVERGLEYEPMAQEVA